MGSQSFDSAVKSGTEASFLSYILNFNIQFKQSPNSETIAYSLPLLQLNRNILSNFHRRFKMLLTKSIHLKMAFKVKHPNGGQLKDLFQ